MNARVPIYEGDGLLREAPPPARTAKRAPAELPRVAAAEASAAPVAAAGASVARDAAGEDARPIEERARALRAEAVGNVFTRLIRAVKRSLWRAEQREVERYLAEATDNADLERRLRDLERSGFHGSYR